VSCWAHYASLQHDVDEAFEFIGYWLSSKNAGLDPCSIGIVTDEEIATVEGPANLLTMFFCRSFVACDERFEFL